MAISIKLTKKQQQYAAAGAVAFVAFCFVYLKFFWLPISGKITDMNSKIEEITRKIDKAKQQAARLPALEKELISLNEQALEAEQRLPKAKSVPDILVTLSVLGQRNRVAVQNFSPGSSSSKQYFIELNYPLTVKGSFHNIGRFLASLALEQRIYNVLNVNYTEPGGDGEMTVTMTLVSYQYKG